MNLIYRRLGLDFTLDENRPLIITVEKPELLSEMIEDLQHMAVDNMDGAFGLYEKEKSYSIFKESTFVYNPFQADCNDKKVINKLYQEIKQISDEYMQERVTHVLASNMELLDDIIQEIPYSINYNIDADIVGMLKMYAVRLEDEYENLIERLDNYIKIISKLCNIHILFLVNIKQYLSTDELNELYQCAAYEKVHIIDFEFHSYDENIDVEKNWIIDKDICIIECN